MSFEPNTACAWRDLFDEAKESLPGAAASRKAAIDRFVGRGFPTVTEEEWRFTNLRPLTQIEFSNPRPEDAISVPLPALPGDSARHRLVFVNGRLRPDLSRVDGLPTGVRLGGLADRLKADNVPLGDVVGSEDPVVALNTALFTDGMTLELAANAAIEEPIHLVFVHGIPGRTPAVHNRVLIEAASGSRARLIETHLGATDEAYLATTVVEVRVGDGARIDHCRVQREGLEGFHLDRVAASVAEGGCYDALALNFGGRLSRTDIHARLEGPRGSCRLFGAYMMRGRQHTDTTTLVEHIAPQTTSEEVYKGVLDDQSRGVFQGKILVRPNAQKIDGHQLSRTLLLSRQAIINTKPELEIHADDVKCSHGATAGELDETALFYLRARGIPEAEARALLIEAFLAEVLEESPFVELADEMRVAIAEWMAAGKTREAA